MKIVSAHQPNFLPYLGFFDKMMKSDVFVIRDEVLYVKKEYHNRNRIRINGNDNLNNPQSKWISVPVIDPKDYILHAKINKESKVKNRNWHENLLNELKTHYSKSRYFMVFYPELKKIFDNSYDSLVDLNMKVIRFLANAFNISTKIILASDLELKPPSYEKSEASEDLVRICKALNADIYLSGAGGKTYLDLNQFRKAGLGVEYQSFDHPIYPQVFPGFLANMSAIDALFNMGKIPKSGEVTPLCLQNS